jgi:hypothetical protein
LVGKQVVLAEEDILDVVARQATGSGKATRCPSATLLGRRTAGQAVLEQLLVLLPPVLPEQGLTPFRARSAPRRHRQTTALRRWMIAAASTKQVSAVMVGPHR